MNSNLLVLIAQIMIFIGSLIYVFFKPGATNPNIGTEAIDIVISKTNLIISMADSFVAWARQFMKNNTGSEKMDEVVKRLTQIAERNNIDITKEEIQAIAQKAYDSMMAAEATVNAAITAAENSNLQ